MRARYPEDWRRLGDDMRLRWMLIAAVLVLCGPTRPATADDVKADFELVDKIGSRKAYEVFLSVHRTGPYADLARERLQAMGPTRNNRFELHYGPNYGDDVFIPRLMQGPK
jgi:hypothetical protein